MHNMCIFNITMQTYRSNYNNIGTYDLHRYLPLPTYLLYTLLIGASILTLITPCTHSRSGYSYSVAVPYWL